METTPTTGTALEVLAAYLPHRIMVEYPLPGNPYGEVMRRTLVGLNTESELATLSNETNIWAAHCQPILRPFSQLCDPLPDGTVPAVEIGKEWSRSSRTAEIVAEYEGYGESCVISGPGTTLSISRTAFEDGRTADWLSKLLRKWHFAVGLEPHQYIVKEAAK